MEMSDHLSQKDDHICFQDQQVAIPGDELTDLR
jgi:hypothetical protein